MAPKSIVSALCALLLSPGGAGAQRALDVTAGEYHVCSRMEDRTVRCWGLDERGQLGGGRPRDRGPLAVPGVRGAAQLALGFSHSCARLDDGAVVCWGAASQGQRGVRAEQPIGAPVPGLDAVEIAAGSYHTCARTRDGRVSCWGNDFGWAPRPIDGLDGVVALTAHASLTCAIRGDGTAWCWSAHPDYPDAPTPVPGAVDLARLSIGVSHAYGQRRDGSILQWEGLHFARRDGGVTDRWVAEGDRARGPFERLAVLSHTACGLRADGTIDCFDDPRPRPREDPTWACIDDGPDRPRRCEPGVPRSQLGIGGMRELLPRLSGPLHRCHYSDFDRATRCSPAAALVRYEYGYERDSRHRAVVFPARGRVEAGGAHACALADDGTVSCWGSNVDGRLGTRAPCVGASPAAPWQLDPLVHGAPTRPDFCPAPMPVPGVDRITHLAVASELTCARRADGAVLCWGRGGVGPGDPGAPARPPRRVPLR